jgi:chloramphenicol 3-O phosphotransferase
MFFCRGSSIALNNSTRERGNNLIVDDVMMEGTSADYAKLLSGFVVFAVGVLAPLDVLEARERERGDRLIGLARWQCHRVHEGMKYDLEVDTSTATAAECATLIQRKFLL